jgi:hypothetical protein
MLRVEELEMIEALTGAFSGVLCALIAATFGFAFSRGRRFDFWILIAGGLFGLIAVQLGVTYFGWLDWILTVGALALFEYGGKVVYARGKCGLEGRVRVDNRNVLKWVFIVSSIVFVEWWIIAFFMWFLPFVFGAKFMVYDIEFGEVVFRWFATSVPQIERDAFVSYLIFATPVFCLLVASPFTFAISNFIRKRRRVQ